MAAPYSNVSVADAMINASRRKKAANRAAQPGNLTAQNLPPTPIAPGPYAPGRVNFAGGGLSMTASLDTPGMRRALGQTLGQQPSVAEAVGGPSAAGRVAAPAPSLFPTLAAANDFSRRWNEPGRGHVVLNPVTGEMAKDVSKSAHSRALPTMTREGVAGVQLVGSPGQFQPSEEMLAKRQVYRDKVGQAQAGRAAAVQANAAARGQARQARLAGRAAGPSVADTVLGRVAADNPAAAAQLLGLHNTRAAQLAIEQQRLAQQGELGRGRLDIDRDRNKAELARYGREDSLKFGELAANTEAAAQLARTNGDFTTYRKLSAEAEQYRRQSAGTGMPAQAPSVSGAVTGQPAGGGGAFGKLDETQQQQFRTLFSEKKDVNTARDALRNFKDASGQRLLSEQEVGEILTQVGSEDDWFNWLGWKGYRTAEDPSYWGSFFSTSARNKAPAPAQPPSVAGAVQGKQPVKPKAKSKPSDKYYSSGRWSVPFGG